MSLVFGILLVIVHVLVLVVLARFVLEMIQSFSRRWRPQGAALLLASAVYSITDPVLNPLRRAIPPLRMGGIALDLSSLILIIGLTLLESLLGGLFYASV